MSIKRVYATVLAAAALCAGLAGGAGAQGTAGKTGWQWAAGGQGSVNANAALAASQAIRQAGFELYAVNSGGTIDSLLTLSRGEYDFANVDTPTLRKVWAGSGGFQQIRGFSQVLTGFPTFFFIVVSAKSPIKTPEDLAGKTINGHTPGAVINLWNQDYVQALAAAGIVRQGSVKLTQIALSQTIDALLDGRIDAQVGYTFAGKLPDWIEQALARGVQFRVLAMPEAVQKTLEAKGWQRDERPEVAEIARIDAAVPKDLRSSGITTVVVARQNLGEDVVYRFLTAFFADPAKIAATHPANRVYLGGPDYGVKYLTEDLPVHPGAQRFYRERNVLRPALAGSSPAPAATK